MRQAVIQHIDSLAETQNNDKKIHLTINDLPKDQTKLSSKDFRNLLDEVRKEALERSNHYRKKFGIPLFTLDEDVSKLT